MRSSARPSLPLSVLDRLSLDVAALHATDSALHLGGLVTFNGEPPSRGRLLEHLRGRIARIPELSHRLAGRTGRPHWEPDPRFDPDRHLYELPGSTDPAAVLAELLRQPLPRDRPLWGIWLVHRAGEGYGLCYRAHHAFQDGAAAVATLERLLGPEEAPRPRALSFRPPRPVPWAAVLPELRPPRRVTWWPALDTPPSQAYAATLADVDTARLHALGRLTGATVPQLCLALATEALRAWHPRDWAPGGPGHGLGLRTNLAISVRDPDDPLPLLGNRVAVAGIDLPCGDPDPLRRLERVGRALDYTRLARLADAHRVILRRFPYRLGRLALTRAIDARYTPLGVADLRIRRPLALDGVPASGVYALPVMVPGQPLFVAWVTHRRRLHVTFTTDTALAGADRLPAAWRAALAELERRAADGEFTRVPAEAGAR
ncbi:wax ester/triacylglycerol synthase domain-containing protein [Streptomyces sp. NPDC127132]|uniref:wax ester/triacylglycerol synthase domain-containing protein n=1 Tax=Streptomyces sp. NPDC127132 TaxID=3345374 RepID=UPI00363D4FB3